MCVLLVQQIAFASNTKRQNSETVHVPVALYGMQACWWPVY